MAARSPTSSLADLVRPGYVAPVWCDGREILRRIFVTVRDQHWQEVAPTQCEIAIDESAGCATFKAHHVSDEVDFKWRGVLAVSENLRELRFAFHGEALRDMQVCRVGLVVLHSVESMVGSQLSVLGPHGSRRVEVPRLISPQPIVNGIPQAMTEPFSSLVIERSDFGKLELQFSGDEFELEDQRNWGDASFKTYCTPLRAGFPRAVKVGTSIAHSVEARFVPSAHKSSSVAGAAAGGVVAPRRVFPRIGRELQPLSASPQSKNDGLSWDHILFRLTKPEDITAFQAVLKSAPPMKIELQVEVRNENGFRPDLLSILSMFRERISRHLICGPGGSLPSAEAVERLRQEIKPSGASSLSLVAATRGYFVEFNRAIKFDTRVTGVAFPLTATVHSDDAETITENVAAIVDIVETARHLTGVSELAISPLALYYPRAAARSNFPEALVRPWLAATLMHAALAGVTSVTLGANLLEVLDSDRSGFISGLLECAGLEVLPVGIPLPARLHALRFVSEGGAPARVLVANLSSGTRLNVDDREVEIPEFGTTWVELAATSAG